MSTPSKPERHSAGLFDVRNIIAALLGIYGIVLIVVGIVNRSADIAKSDGLNLNLWSGVVMLIVAILMGLWAYLRPIIVKEEEIEHDGPSTGVMDTPSDR